MARTIPAGPLDTVKRAAISLTATDDVGAIVDRIGDASLVLIGEASHGTHDFYELRAAVTKRLIETRGFRAVAIEGDWPDSRRVARFVNGKASDATADEALAGFQRFPQWMWRNTVVQEFVTWLRARNERVPNAQRTGFYGLDLYSLHASIDAVLRYLEKIDPPAAERARERYSCFEQTTDDPQAYGYAATRDLIESCEDAVVRQLVDLRRSADEYTTRSGQEDEFFSAEQNARLVANAERYYRSMFRGRASSWNLRDTHMAETLDAIVNYLERDGDARVCVWAHNSHLGDARATQMGRGGELNVGQLVRKQYGAASCLVGFTTYSGTVTAARDWDAIAERRIVRPGLEGSVEELFHRAELPRFLLDMREPEVTRALSATLLERAIGVIYRPETERQSHYFGAAVSSQFDLVIHLDDTRALEPLERTPTWHAGEEAELPETYPFAL
jgi:erythromycin esterase-like protein